MELAMLRSAFFSTALLVQRLLELLLLNYIKILLKSSTLQYKGLDITELLKDKLNTHEFQTCIPNI